MAGRVDRMKERRESPGYGMMNDTMAREMEEEDMACPDDYFPVGA